MTRMTSTNIPAETWAMRSPVAAAALAHDHNRGRSRGDGEFLALATCAIAAAAARTGPGSRAVPHGQQCAKRNWFSNASA